MDTHLDPSPTEPPQLLSARFLRKSKFRKEDPSNERAEASTIETTTNAGACDTPDIVPTNSAVQTSSSPPAASEAPSMISEKNAVVLNDMAISSSEGAISVPSGVSDATNSLAQSDVVPSSLSVLPLSSSPKNLDLAPDTSESSFALSPEELDDAKTLVLDLLGWGVDPEYLIESGVSAEVIFRVFTDLNLRLPKNLVVSNELVDVAYSWGPRPSEFTQTV